MFSPRNSWQQGSSTQQRAQADLKAVLTSNNGQVAFPDLRAAWQAVHGVPLHIGNYGIPNIMAFIDTCRSVCWVAHDAYGEVIKLRYDPTVISNFAATVQSDLHRSGRHVSSAAVISGICAELGVDEFADLGLGPPRQLPRLRRLSELESRLVTHITCYAATRMISTVYDLQISICSSENVTDFDQLQVGPLLKMPLVQTLFKMPGGQAEIIEVTTGDVVETLAAMCRGPRKGEGRREQMQPGDIVNNLVEQKYKGIDPMALGVRITRLGFYIKNVTDAKRAEYETQDIVNRQTERLQQELLKSVEKQKATLQKEQTAKLKSLQQQHAQEVDVIQKLMEARLDRLPHDQNGPTGTSTTAAGATEPVTTVEERKSGCSTILAKCTDPPVWSGLHSFVKQLDPATMSSLSAFSKAVATHLYSTVGIDSSARVGYSLGQLDLVSFWQTDLLAGLLMQALMLFVDQDASKDAMLVRLASLSSSIKIQTSELNESLLKVPDAVTAKASTKWVRLYWNFLRISTDWIYADNNSDDETGSQQSVYVEDLINSLHASFGASQPGSQKGVDSRKRKFWSKDCLANALFQALDVYLDSNHAYLDGNAIQQWLAASEQAGPDTQQKAASQLGVENAEAETNQQLTSDIEPVDVVTLQAAIGQMSNGFSIAALARLEQNLLQHFQVTHFAQLGHGPSLVHLLSRNEDVRSCMKGSEQESTAVPLDQVMNVMDQAMQHLNSGSMIEQESEAVKSAIKQALCSHFRVVEVHALGQGSLQHLVQLQQQSHDVPATSLLCLAAQTCTAAMPAVRQANVDASKAVEQLQSAPELADLSEWTRWDLLCEPHLGLLHTFLQQQGSQSQLTALELPGGKLIKVDPGATPSQFLQAASCGDGRAAVAALLGQVAGAGGISRAPLALLADHAEAAFQTLQARSVASGKAEMSDAATFLVEALKWLPQLVWKSLAQDVLLKPFHQACGSQSAAESAVLDACQDEGTAQLLYGLGHQLDIPQWQKPWLDHMDSQRTKPKPNAQATSQPEPIDVSPTEASATDSVMATAAGMSDLASLLPANVADGLASSAPVYMQGEGEAVTQTLEQLQREQQPSAIAEDTSAQQQIVENIRQVEFGIGIQLDAQGADLRERQNERLGRALHRLSQDLYSKDVHFVLELVQNADDNTYQADATPALEFILEDSGITIMNNEVGFSEGNIRALCDVGSSTKQHKIGYIGQKGIGFKSVFKVTDAAEIHSGGFHIKFDLTLHQALGYTLPTWVDPATAVAQPLPRVPTLQSAATQVYLPFKQEVQQGLAQLLRNFDDVQPTLLLFLKKLQCIAITDKTSNHRNSVMLRQQLPNAVVELRHGDQAQHVTKWLVVSQALQPSVKRLDVEVPETELAVAFELGEQQPRQQQVFAFLPLRKYGLRFIVQADFVVPSSREAVDNNNAWNQELRSQLPDLFLKALAFFKALRSEKHLSWVDCWLQCIPLHGEAEEFFAPCPQAITSCLRSAPCIATEDNDWVLPAEAVICNEQATAARQLLAHATQNGIAGAKYVNPSLTALHSSTVLRSALGIKTLDVEHLLHVLQCAHVQNKLPQLGMQWCAQMLACIFDMLAAKDPSLRSIRAQDYSPISAVQSVLQQLAVLPVFPLTSDSWAAAGTDPARPLFNAITAAPGSLGKPGFTAATGAPGSDPKPVFRGTAAAPGSVASNQAAGGKFGNHGVQQLHDALKKCQLNIQEMQLQVIAEGFVQGAGSNAASLSKLMQVLGVHDIGFTDIIDRHILPALASEESLHLPAATLVSYLAFICLSGLLNSAKFDAKVPDLPHGRKLLKQLLQCAVVHTNKGSVKVAKGAAVHFPVSLGNKFDLRKNIPQHDFLLVSDAYAQQKIVEPSHFRRVLFQLGISDCIQVPKRELVLSPTEKLQSPWATADLGDAPQGGWGLQDFACEEFEAVVQSVLAGMDDSQSLRSLQYLAEMVSAQWAAHYSHNLTAACTSRSGEIIKTHSSFKWAVMNLAWLPSSSGSPSQGGSLFYRANRELYQVLQDHVPYLHANIKAPDMLTCLGVRSEVTAPMLLEVLTSWAQQPGFATSLQHMTQVYEHLAWQMQSDPEAAAAICTAFQSTGLIWLPEKAASQPAGDTAPHADDDRQNSRKKTTAGKFYSTADKVFFKDHTRVIEDTSATAMRVLVKYYFTDDLHSFFLEQLHYTSKAHAPQASFANAWGGQQSHASAFQPIVPMYPSTADYCELLASLAYASEVDDSRQSQAVTVLLHWSGLIARGVMPYPDVQLMQTALHNRSLLPTTDKRWVTASDGLYIMDDAELAKAFKEKPVHFLWLPESMQPSASRGMNAEGTRLQPLLDAIGIPWLSASVTQEAMPSGSHYNTQVTHMISGSFPFLQRYYFYHRPTEYNRIAGRVLPLLKGFSCSETTELYVLYSLDPAVSGKPAIRSSIKRNAFLQQPDASGRSMLHVVEGDAGNLHDAFCELSTFFDPGYVDPDLPPFMQALSTTQLAGQSVDTFMAKRKYHAMPQHEDVWAAPVSDMPAAYNLHARMQALAEQQQQEQAEDTLQEPEQDHHQAAREQQPRKAMQPVEVWPPAAPRVASGHKRRSEEPSEGIPRTTDTYLYEGAEVAGASSPRPDKMVKTGSGQPMYSSPSQQDRWPLCDHLHTGPADPTSYSSHSKQAGDQRMSPGISDALAARLTGQTDGRRMLSELHDRTGVIHRASPEKTGSGTGQAAAADGTAAMEVDTAMDTAEGMSRRASGLGEGHQSKQRNPRQAGTSPAKEQQDIQSANIGVPFTLPAVPAAEAVAGIEELELPHGISHQVRTALPDLTPSRDNKEMVLEVGRWGEELVYRFLQASQGPASDWHIQWMNADFNTATPYDLHLVGPDGAEQFIEVKSSLAVLKAFFEMSYQEVEMAKRKGNQYILYRVSGVGTATPSVLRIVNPMQKWAAGHIKVCVVL